MNIIHNSSTGLLAEKILAGPSLASRKNVYLEMENGIIKKIEPAMDGDNRRGILHLPGITLIPGPVDCHVHLALDGKDFRGCLEKWSRPELMDIFIKQQLKAHLEKGITCVRDGGDRSGLALSHNARHTPGPHVVACGAALRRRDMYGSFLGPGLEKHHIPKAISFMAARGARQIKVLVSGVVSFKEYGRVGPIQFDLPELRQIVRATGNHGLKVMAHASSDRAVKICVRAGVHSIEHGYFLERDTLEMMAEKKIYWVPTVVPVANQLQKHRAGSFSIEEQKVIEKTYKRQLEMICMAQELGVPLAIGTDAGAAGVLHGKSFHEEIKLYARAGLSNYQILKAATINASGLLGLNPGLEAGKPARFIGVKGDPLENINILERPVCIAL